MAMIDDLREYIEIYDKVIWIEDINFDISSIDSLSYTNNLDNQKKIVILCTGKKCYLNNSICTYRIMDFQELEELRRLYYLYDFSNKFVAFSKTQICGSVLNYVKEGILSIEEVQKIM